MSANVNYSAAAQADLPTQRALTLIGLAALTTFLLSVIPLLGWINFPFRLLVTMVHELGHGLAAMLTGGEFIRFVVSADGAGLAYTSGGWRFFVIPAGYLGAALFGALLIMLGRSHRWSRVAMAVIGAALILLSLRYGIPTIFAGQILGGLLTTIGGVLLGALFVWVAVKASAAWITYLLHIVAIKAGLMAFADIFTAIGLSAGLSGGPRNDAQSMAELTYIPAIVWALLWAVAALALIGGAIWITWIAPLRKKN